MYDIRLVALVAANDDGSMANDGELNAMGQSIRVANLVYNPHGLNFVFDPATDVYRVNDDRLNREVWRRDHAVLRDQHVDPNGDPALGFDDLTVSKNAAATRFPGRLVVLFTSGSCYGWHPTENRWRYGRFAANYSHPKYAYVSMLSLSAEDWLAHEIGHYFNIWHTHSAWPASVADAVKIIQQHVNSGAGTRESVYRDVFDNDDDAGVHDTPPDPGPALFHNQCDPAESSVSFVVQFQSDPPQRYTFTPDRDNVMSYWNKGNACRGTDQRITSDQATRVREALLGNRRQLVAPAVFYSGTFAPGDRSQTGAFAWSLNDFAKRFNDELASGRHCVHMQGYDIGGGQIRYDGIWETGGDKGQHRAISWSLNDFVARWDQEAASGRRVVHLQAYDIGGGQIRYDAIWEVSPGSQQRRALAFDRDSFTDRFHETTTSSGLAGWHLETMIACRRDYLLPPLTASLSAGRAAPATVSPRRGPLDGCELGANTPGSGVV